MSRKRRTSSGPSAPRIVPPPPKAPDWGSSFLTALERTGLLTTACLEAGITIAQVYRRREYDPAFAAAFEAAQAMRRSILGATLEDAAIAGDTRAARLVLAHREALAGMEAVTSDASGAFLWGHWFPSEWIRTALSKTYEELARLRHLREGWPPPFPAELEGAVICPACGTIAGNWAWAGDWPAVVRRCVELPTVIGDAWMWHHHQHTTPGYATLLPDPNETNYGVHWLDAPERVPAFSGRREALRLEITPRRT